MAASAKFANARNGELVKRRKTKTKTEDMKQKPSKKMPWKACGLPARFVVMAEGYDHPFCKRCGPEEAFKKTAVLYRKARAGEKCGTSNNWRNATVDMLDELGRTGDADFAFEKFRRSMRGES